jgi:hypothetical protein
MVNARMDSARCFRVPHLRLSLKVILRSTSFSNDQAKLNEQLSGSVNGITAAVNQNSQLLNELIQLEKGKAAAAPASAVPPVAPVLPPKLEEAKEKADAVLQSPVVQHIVAFIAIVGLVLLGRAVYLKCHADKDKIAALLPDGARKQFLALDDFNTKLYEDLRGRHYDSEAKLSEVQDNLVKVALATPAPSQVAPAAVPPVTK